MKQSLCAFYYDMKPAKEFILLINMKAPAQADNEVGLRASPTFSQCSPSPWKTIYYCKRDYDTVKEVTEIVMKKKTHPGPILECLSFSAKT